MTFVITCCDRMDLLDRTLKSFFKFNTYPIDSYIMVNDSADAFIHNALRDKYGHKFTLILSQVKLGLSASIDKAYSMCKDAYIFHCEDDWEFYRKGFIEESMQLLTKDVHQVWVRSQADTPHKCNVDGTIPEWNGWNGFSWNPGLRRLKDWKEMFPNGYREFKDEFLCAQHTKQFDYKVVTLQPGACKHIGYGLHTQDWVD